MKLVILESPSKARTVKGYLGNDYNVLSSYGHIRDLAISGEENLGIDISNNFEPIYELDSKKKRIINTLKKAVGEADEVYLATDPDREGEAISWHLAEVLNLDVYTTKRVEFHEITRRAVTEAFNNPKHIDLNLVRSQETRRILDRIIGFKLSTLMQKKTASKSAGRVQSVVVKLIVEKENEINNFQIEDYYTINGKIIVDNVAVDVKLIDDENEVIRFKSQEEAQKVIDTVKHQEVTLKNVELEHKTNSSKAVYTTSTMQQDAANILKFDSKKTMKIAQKLYEGVNLGKGHVGLITYMRTDSVRVNPQFINLTKAKIEELYGKEYIGTAKIFNKSGNVQDAHEGIRPTDVNITPEIVEEKVGKDEAKLYKLIYARTMASMMKEEKYDKTTAVFSCKGYSFLASGEQTTFDGHTKVSIYSTKHQRTPLPVDITPASQLGHLRMTLKSEKTKPPFRYNEARLIQTMEQLGIGRPSTYASTLDTIKARDYVKIERGFYVPTEQGSLTTEKLNEFFGEVINVEYTSQMETKLDEIALGELDKVDALNDFYQLFDKHIKDAYLNMEEHIIPKATIDVKCPNCGKDLVQRHGRYGSFYACSGYPECKYIYKEEKAGKECPKCHEGHLVMKKGKYGSFYACSNYPKCEYIEKK